MNANIPSFDQSLFFLLDGFRPDILKKLIDENKLPNLKELFVDNGTFWTGSTVFPSTTGPAYLPFITGCYPGVCNVPGIRWVDREHFHNGSWSKKGTRSYVGYESFFFNQDISPDTKTLFEIFPNHLSVHNIVNRGVVKSSEPSKIFSSLLIFAAKLTHQWDMVDHLAASLAQKFLEKNQPKFSFIAFLGVDEAAHLSTPSSEKTVNAYIQVDQAVGKIISVLKKKNLFDKTLIFASADHGLSETKHHFELCDFVDQMGFKTFVYPKVYQRNNTAACMVSGNAMAHLYFKNGESWNNRMFHQDLVNRNLLAPLIEQPAVDILISKTAENHVMISSKRGTAEISKKNGQLQYAPKSGDPFGFSKELSSQNDYFDATIDSDYPDAIAQAWQIMQSKRAGDLIVTSTMGYDLRDRFEIPEHFSSHGSLHREHMLVPILCNQKINSNVPKRTVNVFPTMLKCMGVDYKDIQISGESFI